MTIGGEDSCNGRETEPGTKMSECGVWQGPSRDEGEKRGGYLNIEQV